LTDNTLMLQKVH